MVTLNHGGFKGKVSRDTLLCKSGMMSLRSLFLARYIKLLHKLSTELRSEPLNERLMSQSYVQSTCDHRLYFYDYSARKVGRASFIKELNPHPNSYPLNG